MAQSQQSKFVSGIPKNTLEPVFLGGGNGPTSNSSGKFVPSFLSGGASTSGQKGEEKKNFNLANENFPSLFGDNSSATNTSNLVKRTNTISYSEAIKKPKLETPETKVTVESTPQKQAKKVVRHKAYDYFDEYCDKLSDEEYYGSEDIQTHIWSV